jgi:glycosyltransferase involved in cell wall biosynthesis
MAQRRPVQVVTSRTTRALSSRRASTPGVEVRRLRALRVAKIPVMPGLVWALLRLPRRSTLHLHLGQALVPELVLLAARLRGHRLVVHFHLDIEPSGPLGALFASYKRRVLPRVLRAAGRVVCLTEEQAEHLVGTVGVARGRVRVVPNAVGEQFRVTGRTPHDGALRLLFVGRLSAQKNLPRLLDAIGAVESPVQLTIVGDGELRPYVEERLRALPGVILAGQLDGERLLDEYRWADALVLTSDHEGMPLVLLEAMSAGLAVVANDVPGIRATVGEDALVVNPTAEDVAAGIDRLARDPQLRADLAARGRARAERHTWASLLDTLEQIYDDPSW